MKLSHRTHWCNESNLTSIKLAKGFVLLYQGVELSSLVSSIARQKHPQVINRWRVDAVIEVDKCGFSISPQNIANVAVAVRRREIGSN
jgi:hypothetical protein